MFGAPENDHRDPMVIGHHLITIGAVSAQQMASMVGSP